jgi:4-amino-4-deoxy-L-arabinose transferase-like glycosyltransferase
VEKITLKLKSWIKNNPLEFWTLIVILLVGAFCRLYKIDQYMTFLGDEGRDVIIVRRLLTEGHPPLIGPGTSIGGMYLGPFYYYLMAPALLLANFSPVGPAVQIAILGVVTIWFVWYVGRVWFGKEAGLIASGLYAISPTVIIYSRSSWNPNIMPFFALLSVYSIWKVWKNHSFNWLLVLGLSFAAVLQSHYLGLLLAPTLGIFWFLTLRKLKLNNSSKKKVNSFLIKSIFGSILFLVLMSPLFFFDLRHNWINTRAMYQFFTVRQTTVSVKPWTAIPKIPEMMQMINTNLIGGKDTLVGKIASILFGLALIELIYITVKRRGVSKVNPAYFLLLSWIGFGLIGFGIYKQNIYDHYFGFLFPIPYLLIGLIVASIFKDGKLGKLLGVVVISYLVFVNLAQNPLKFQPNKQLERAVNVAKKIEAESSGARFNLGVIAERNYEDGYKYFLLKDRSQVVDIDSQDKNSITNQLFVVCELAKTKCDPTHNAVAAVANFGWSKIDSSWEVSGVIVYKLVHSKL